MNPIVKNILAVVAGIIVGSLVNMGIIILSGKIIPPPPGVDVTTTEGLKAGILLFEPRHFIMPFLAHSLGTFVGAFVTAKLASNRKMLLAFLIGAFFLVGGIASVSMLPAPMWFNVLDLGLAYIPVAVLAGKLAIKKPRY